MILRTTDQQFPNCVLLNPWVPQKQLRGSALWIQGGWPNSGMELEFPRVPWPEKVWEPLRRTSSWSNIASVNTIFLSQLLIDLLWSRSHGRLVTGFFLSTSDLRSEIRRRPIQEHYFFYEILVLGIQSIHTEYCVGWWRARFGIFPLFPCSYPAGVLSLRTDIYSSLTLRLIRCIDLRCFLSQCPWQGCISYFSFICHRIHDFLFQFDETFWNSFKPNSNDVTWFLHSALSKPSICS